MFDSSNPVQHHLKIQKGDVGRYVILPGDPFRTDLIASFLDDAILVAHNREHKTWTGYLDGTKVSVTSTGMGCPSAAIAVEELIRCGADTFIRVGNAGAVRNPKERDIFDGVIVTGAVREDGTSKQYVPSEYPAIADRFIVDALATAARVKDLKYLEGIAHCKDSFYGEVEPKKCPMGDALIHRWEIWKKSNVICSEMETSAIFIISMIRQTRAGAIMNWGNMENTIQVACDAIRLLIKNDKQRTQNTGR